MKLLLLDIETAPTMACVWGLFDQTINPDWIISDGYVLCYAAQWYDSDEIIYDSIKKSGKKKMIRGIHRLMDEADAIITYNGKRFDLPVLKTEIIEAGMVPPAPHKDIDLYPIIKGTFKFKSNKLDYVAQKLGVGKKVKHRGPQLWLDCMDNKDDAWDEMEAYNKHDVVLLRGVYEKVRPWIRNHPNAGLYMNKDGACPNCGADFLQRRGFAFRDVQKYQRYQCRNCGKWCRDTKPLNTKNKTLKIMRPI